MRRQLRFRRAVAEHAEGRSAQHANVLSAAAAAAADNFDLLPDVGAACKVERRMFCEGVPAAHGAVLDCLADFQDDARFGDECRYADENERANLSCTWLRACLVEGCRSLQTSKMMHASVMSAGAQMRLKG